MNKSHLFNNIKLSHGAIILGFLMIWGLYWFFDGENYLTIQGLKDKKESLLDLKEAFPWTSLTLYFVIYITLTGFSLPGAAIMSLFGGAIFGFWQGFVSTSFASTIGASCAFLMARLLFRETLEKKFPEQVNKLSLGFKKDGLFYLFSLRLVPLFPFFLINTLMGLTPISLKNFYVISQVAMLPGTLAYIYAGTVLSQIESPNDILSPSILIALTLLGVLPLVAKKIINKLSDQRHPKDLI